MLFFNTNLHQIEAAPVWITHFNAWINDFLITHNIPSFIAPLVIGVLAVVAVIHRTIMVEKDIIKNSVNYYFMMPIPSKLKRYKNDKFEEFENEYKSKNPLAV